MKKINLLLSLFLFLASFNVSARVVIPKECKLAQTQYHQLMKKSVSYSKYKHYIVKRIKILKSHKYQTYKKYVKAADSKKYKLAYTYKKKMGRIQNQINTLHRKLGTIYKVQKSIYYSVIASKKKISKFCGIK